MIKRMIYNTFICIILVFTMQENCFAQENSNVELYTKLEVMKKNDSVDSANKESSTSINVSKAAKSLDYSKEKMIRVNNQNFGVYEYGKDDGQVVFYFHGFPGSRLDGFLFDFDSLARDLGLRIIAIDRPGIGNSDFIPDRKLIDWVITTSTVADSLNVKKFSVLGISGGGPYALAVAHGIQDRLYSVTVVSGMGPFQYKESLNGTAMMIPKLNSIVRKMVVSFMKLGISKNTEKFKENIIKTLPECDKNYLVESGKLDDVIVAFQESLKQGNNGYLEEAKIYRNKWQFNMSEIKTKVILYHGSADNNVKIELAKRIESEIPNCQANYFEDEGHFSLTGKFLKTILTEIKQNIND